MKRLCGRFTVWVQGVNALPDVPASVNDALEASVSARIAVNAQIALGRGPEVSDRAWCTDVGCEAANIGP